MSAISKFLFDADFSKAAKAVVAPPTRRSYTPAEYDAAKTASYAKGHEAGRSEMATSIEQAAANATAMVAEQLKVLLAGASEAHMAAHRQAIAAAATFVDKILPALLKRHGLDEIETLIRECLSRLHDEPRIVVRVNDAILDSLQTRLDSVLAAAGFSGRVVLLAEDGLDPADARIEWADGGAERDVAAVRQEIDSILQRFTELEPAADTVAGNEE
jgi:flagellar assembly protein FliH